MSFRLVISATFTAEPIEPVLAFWGRQLESPFEIRFAPYNQVLQTLVDPASEFALNQHGANVVVMRLEDLAQFDGGEEQTLGSIDSHLNEIIGVVRDAAQRTNVPLLFVLCPPSPAFVSGERRAQFAHAAAMRIESMLEGTPGVVNVSHEHIQRLYPVASAYNAEGERLGRIPYTDLYFSALGTTLVRMAHGLFLPPFKVIALDCDNTLWRGICGEDGPQGIVVDAARRRLQEFMVEQRDNGMLLVLASKNNERDVTDTFEQNPEMPLQLRHFVSWRLDWDPKTENLRAIAKELSLGLDSFIFVDDNPKECAELEESLPEVLALTLPVNEDEIPHFLDHVWAFDHVQVTEEDRNRSAYYAQAQEFGRALKRAATLEDFFASLDLRVTFRPLTSETVTRVAQLTQRTNQFNFTTIRRTEGEISGLLDDRGMECTTLDVADRFGEYGLTGVILYRENAKSLDIDTFLLSCRVLGRGVEYRAMAYLGAEALRRGLKKVRATLQLTKKNAPARKFLHEIGAGFEHKDGDSFAYEWPAEVLRDLVWKPSSEAPPRAAETALTAPAAARKRPDYTLIANTLSTPGQVLAAVRSQAIGLKAGVAAPAHAMSGTEMELATIWCELLHCASVNPSDNFFDLGGHSLLVVLLIVRVRETFGVELPIEDVYSADLTLSELARKIEAHQLADPVEYEALLKEIESMPDEEVKRLLEEEDRGLATA